MIKIFLLDRCIYLTDIKQNNNKTEGRICPKTYSKEELKNAYTVFKDHSSQKALFLQEENLEDLFNKFSTNFTIIDAAGGLVENNKKELLFIYRIGKWDLPKGKVEQGENIKEAAVREVEEECGITQLTITDTINPTYHIYYINEKPILKRTYWFKMKCEDESKLTPQTEEGITDVKWINSNRLNEMRMNTYSSIIEVLDEVK